MSKRTRKSSNHSDDPEENAQQANQGYSWEEEYKRSWDVIKEDGQGALRQIINNVNKQLRAKRHKRITQKIQRGIIRSLVVCLDLTVQQFEKDLHPNRFILTLGYLDPFIYEFLDQNPLSQIGFIATKDARAYRLSELSGNPSDHTSILKNLISRFGLDETSLKLDEKGQSTEISVLNSLKMCENMLATVPFHTSKEILFIVSSLCSVDSINVLEYVKSNNNFKSSGIRISIICLSAEVFLYKSLIISERCFGCLKPFEEQETTSHTKRRDSIKSHSSDTKTNISGHFQCSKCHNEFCLECDVFIHDTLHNCPGC